jgi:HEAT repeat protein
VDTGSAVEGVNRDSLPEMRNLIVILAFMLVWSGPSISAQLPSQTPLAPNKLVQRDPELKHFLDRLGSFQTRLSSEMWTLVHAYESKDEVDHVLNYFVDFFKAVESDDEAKYEQLGGLKGFKEQFSKFLDSKDEAVKCFALFIVGVSGDSSFVPKIIRFVNERDPSFIDRFPDKSVFSRGRAAIALGMLDAKQSKSDIAKLLKSKNKSDRSGAAFALADLHGVEYTNQIVSLLNNKEFQYDDDDSPIYFLVDTGQARTYKKEIAATMAGEFMTKTAETAAYALASIDAKEFSPQVAASLKNQFRRSWASKVLALMHATEYSDQIASLLKDRSMLVRSAAATSLGILNSKKYIPALAQVLITDKDSSVRHDAAIALIRLEASNYYERSLKELNGAQAGREYSVTDYHEFVQKKVEALDAELEKKLAVARSATKTRP